MADITMSYDGLRNTWGVKVLQDTVTAVDASARKVTLASGGVLSYDRLVLSPGIEFMYDQVPGLETEAPVTPCCTPGRRVPRPWPCASNWRT
jgi:sulfite dehydrogenase